MDDIWAKLEQQARNAGVTPEAEDIVLQRPESREQSKPVQSTPAQPVSKPVTTTTTQQVAKPAPKSAPKPVKEEDAEATVLEQGGHYEEKDEQGNAVKQEQGATRNQFKRQEPESEQTEEFEEESKFAKLKPVLIIGGIGLVVLLLIVGVVGYSAHKKKLAEEERIRQEELAAAMIFKYTAEEREALRVAGFTGTEIEEFETLEKPAAPIIEEAERKRKEKYDAEIAPYLDGASDEYKQLAANSWVGQPSLEYDPTVSAFTYHSKVMNLDYEKLPPTGHQLFIKFYLLNGEACFMTVTPERYGEMRDSGNIVLNIEYTKTADGKTIITNVTEIQN